MKAFIESQFGYCPLTWMFHGRKANNKINHIHERALRIVHKNNVLTFEELLKLDKSFTIHHKNIQSLAIEIFKVKNDLSNAIMNDIFELRSVSYSLRSQTDFVRPSVNTEHFGINSLRFFANRVWDIVPNEIKNSRNLDVFKSKIRKWEPKERRCKLCINYFRELGYVN